MAKSLWNSESYTTFRSSYPEIGWSVKYGNDVVIDIPAKGSHDLLRTQQIAELIVKSFRANSTCYDALAQILFLDDSPESTKGKKKILEQVRNSMKDARSIEDLSNLLFCKAGINA